MKRLQNTKNKKVHLLAGEKTLCGMTGAEIPGLVKTEFRATTLPVDCKSVLTKKPSQRARRAPHVISGRQQVRLPALRGR